MGDAFFGADGDDGFGVGIEGDVVARLVPIADGAAEAGDAFGEGVAMGFGAARGGLELAGDVEDVGGQALDAGEFVHGNPR